MKKLDKDGYKNITFCSNFNDLPNLSSFSRLHLPTISPVLITRLFRPAASRRCNGLPRVLFQLERVDLRYQSPGRVLERHVAAA